MSSNEKFYAKHSAVCMLTATLKKLKVIDQETWLGLAERDYTIRSYEE